MTWFRNDRRVCENSHIRCVNEGNFYCIELTPVSLDDVGRWMCMAENASGRNSCLCVLNVLVPKAYKPPEFVEHLRALLTEEGLVSLECKVVGVPTPLLRWFKDSKGKKLVSNETCSKKKTIQLMTRNQLIFRNQGRRCVCTYSQSG